MKKYKLLFLGALLMLPTIVYGQELNVEGFPLIGALAMESFVTIHMSIFVLSPLSKIFSKDGDSKKLFWQMFFIRIGILLFFDFFITPAIAMIDFFAVFVGAFLIVPLSAFKNKNSDNNVIMPINNTNTNVDSAGVILKCAKCNSVMTVKHKFCENCGEPFSGDNVKVEMDPNAKTVEISKNSTKPSDFDSMFSLSEDAMLEEFINRELMKANIDKNSKLIPSDILKRKKIFNIIFSVLVFVYITLIFFHFPLLTYIIGLVLLFIFFKFTRSYNLIKYLKKQLKARPSEKVSNIVMSVKTTTVEDMSNKIFLPSLLVAIILPLIMFNKPVILYEKMDGGYGVRFYAFGLTNFTTATIPEKHKGEDVISLRGNTFSNMPLLKEVNLPDTIIEIRGQAFKNNISLKSVKLPSKLTYLGGGAFYNCTSLKSIEIPDSVTYIGGEAFYNAESLKSVKLPPNLTEIRGNTFEYCSSLESIVIPDSVTRIGGHAFYGNSLLSSVSISENSKLREIGSSAFRQCDSLYKITIPDGVYVNQRAFKESPTNIYEYGSLKLGYENEGFLYMYVGNTEEINEYRTSANLQGAYITLVDVVNNNGSSEFILKYSDSKGEQTITLTRLNKHIVINDNLAIEVADDYVFSYIDKVSLNTYYN